MNEIAEMKKKIRSLQKKQSELSRQEDELRDEVRKLENAKRIDRIRKGLHEGDVRIVNEGVTHYHCTPLRIFEIIYFKEHTGKYFHNGVPTTYQSFTVKVREFGIHCADGDMNSYVEVRPYNDVDDLLKAKKMPKADFEEFKQTLLFDPQAYENSKWDPKRKE